MAATVSDEAKNWVLAGAMFLGNIFYRESDPFYADLCGHVTFEPSIPP